ncbi:hypothetical protein H5410_046838 [Solanum commersonii]|uniref:Uncharacterized protein n=1 Tax=Solanum commersonii TaxID=4109 RepID=A0A9J5XGM5_SOLCO|nr:hypothetical protein H5410_046838 [Solanum commersonii]
MSQKYDGGCLHTIYESSEKLFDWGKLMYLDCRRRFTRALTIVWYEECYNIKYKIVLRIRRNSEKYRTC